MKELDFLPLSFHQAIARRREHRRNMALSVALVLAMGVLHVVNNQRINSAQASLAALRGASGAFQNARDLAESYRTRKALLLQQTDLLNRLEDNAPPDAVLAEVTRYMTKAMALRAIEIESHEGRAKSVESSQQRGRGQPEAEEARELIAVPERELTQVRLTGIAATDLEVGVFFGRLSSSPLFDDVQMVFSQETTVHEQPMREFQLTFVVKRIEITP